MKTIGIKLADGSFYPVLEDNKPSEKRLELTTAHNNQTKVMVDLYRSATCSMDDAEYVDSLQIENLVARPNGETDIKFSVSLIYDKEHQKYMDDIASRRKTLVSTGDRSAKIRTYNFPQGRVTDHRIGYTTHDLQGFLGGDIQAMIDALIVAENAERMKETEL